MINLSFLPVVFSLLNPQGDLSPLCIDLVQMGCCDSTQSSTPYCNCSGPMGTGIKCYGIEVANMTIIDWVLSSSGYNYWTSQLHATASLAYCEWLMPAGCDSEGNCLYADEVYKRH